MIITQGRIPDGEEVRVLKIMMAEVDKDTTGLTAQGTSDSTFHGQPALKGYFLAPDGTDVTMLAFVSHNRVFVFGAPSGVQFVRLMNSFRETK